MRMVAATHLVSTVPDLPKAIFRYDEDLAAAVADFDVSVAESNENRRESWERAVVEDQALGQTSPAGELFEGAGQPPSRHGVRWWPRWPSAQASWMKSLPGAHSAGSP
jgi:hypothetical protein